MLRRVPESCGPHAALDVPGLVLATGAALGIVWGLVRGNAAGWGSAEVLGALVAGAALDRRLRRLGAARPRSRCCRCACSGLRAFAAGNARSLLMFGALFTAVFFMAQFLQTRSGTRRSTPGSG